MEVSADAAQTGGSGGSAPAPRLTLSWEELPRHDSRRSNTWITIRGDHLPAPIRIHYLEAYVRANSTHQPFREKSVIGHETRLISLSDDRTQIKSRDTLADGVVLEHTITTANDEVDFRIRAHNPTASASEAHWAQPCVRLGDFTGLGEKTTPDKYAYLARSFIFLDGQLSRLPTRSWATEAIYTPGQVWCPAHVPRTDVNPRPLSPLVPSDGLIGCFSGGEKMIWATAWEPYQELFQGVGRCLHSDFRLGGLAAGETKNIRGKIYLVPNDLPALRARYERDFPEHIAARAPAPLSATGAAGAPAIPPVTLPTANEEIVRAAAAAPLALQFRGSTPAELATWQREFGAKLRTMIGPHAPPRKWTVRVRATREFPDHTREELLLEADATPSLPLYVLRPKSPPAARFPIVLCLHGHGAFGHDPVAGVDDSPELREEIGRMNYDYGRQMVREGYLAVVPCFTPFGRRLDAKAREGRSDPCAVAFVRLLVLGRTLLGENVRDAIWALDYAANRPDARSDRIGCVGLSYGGRLTMVVAALEPRVQVAVISGALNVFQERIQGAGYSCGAQVIPGLLQIGDTPEIGSLIAPRPAIWEAGRQDRLMVPGWLEKASGRIERAYAAAGRPENFSVHRFDGGHAWHGATAVPLLAKILKAP